MRGVCHIVGAGDMEGARPRVCPGDFVIAADAGFARLEALGVEADLVVGDFDSLGHAPDHPHIVRHPAVKDDTDMFLAVREGLERGYARFAIYGGMGGRLDHTLGNLQVLAFLENQGVRGYLMGDLTVAMVKNREICFPAGLAGTISVFAYGGAAKGVYEEGLAYSLHDAVLETDTTLGVSNAFTGAEGRVRVREGMLAVLWQEPNFDPHIARE